MSSSQMRRRNILARHHIRFHSGYNISSQNNDILHAIALALFSSLSCKPIMPTHHKENLQLVYNLLFAYFHSINQFLLVSCCIQAPLLPLYTFPGEYPFKNRNIMNNYTKSVVSKRGSRLLTQTILIRTMMSMQRSSLMHPQYI